MKFVWNLCGKQRNSKVISRQFSSVQNNGIPKLKVKIVLNAVVPESYPASVYGILPTRRDKPISLHFKIYAYVWMGPSGSVGLHNNGKWGPLLRKSFCKSGPLSAYWDNRSRFETIKIWQNSSILNVKTYNLSRRTFFVKRSAFGGPWRPRRTLAQMF